MAPSNHVAEASRPSPARLAILAFALVGVGLAAATTLIAGAESAAAAPGRIAAPRPPAAAGSIDSVSGSSGVVRVRGWALNPKNANGLGVFISVDTSWHLAPAAGLRADVWRSFPRSGPFHGYDASFPASPGRHFVCVVAGGGGTSARVLGCRFVDVAPPPVGSFDGTPVVGDEQVRVTGWVVQPDSPASVDVRVEVDGVVRATGRADSRRDDIAAAFPGVGSAHGVDLVSPVPVGTHLVCLHAVDGNGVSTLIGCKAVTMPLTRPRGSLDNAWVDGDGVVATGWADDPDGNGPLSVSVAVTRSGFNDPSIATGTADQSRPDVGALLGISPQRGFTVRVPAVEAGERQICLVGHNQNFGSDQLLGCRSLSISDRRPVGAVDVVTPVGGSVTVSGWYADPDGASAVTVRVVVDGVSHPVSANGSRPDVGAAFPAYGPNRGFSATVSGLSSGVHDVCVVATDIAVGAVGLTADTAPPCGSAVIGSIAVGTPGSAIAPSAVGPAPGSPLGGIARDGGVSVPLRNGSTLWLFADSMAKHPDGSLKYFVNNTAAWAAAGNPGVTYDAVSGSGPVQFVSPGGSFPSCSDASMSRALWPMSAVAFPASDDRDRVIVYLANMCLTGGANPVYEPHGVAVAQWYYDPATHAPGQAIQGTFLNQRLFTDVDTAEAAVVAPDGYLYVYGCDGPANGGWPTEYGPCTVGRVTEADVANASAYRYWNGAGWGTGSGTALSMPDGRDGVTNLPPGGVNVVYDAVNEVFVMGYSPWPGFTKQVALRFATTPQGPWTAPVVATLPGCDDAVGGQGLYCYAAAVQPRFSRPGLLGIGYFDQAVAVSPLRGSYTSALLPLFLSAP